MSRTLALLFAFTIAVTWGASASDAQLPEDVDRGSYSVAASERGFVLVDQQTGRTWILEASAEPEAGPVWVPLERIDEHQEGENWRSRKLAISEEQRQNAERERAERLETARRQRPQREHVEREHPHDHRPSERGERDGGPPMFRREAEERRRHDLRELIERTERNRDLFVEQVGEDHPSARTRNEMLERLREQLEHAEGDRHGRADDVRARERDEVEQRRSEFRRRAEEQQRQHRQKHLESLKQQYEQLQGQFSEDHPSVQALSQLIERMKDELEDKPESDIDAHDHEGEHGDHDHGHHRREHGDSQVAEEDKTLSELKPLLLKEQQLLLKLGPQHPEVVEVSRQIELLRSMQGEDGVEHALSEHDERLKREADIKARARKAALRTRILATRADVTRRLEELKQKYGEDAPGLDAAEGVLELIQSALNDLESAHELEDSHQHGHEDSHNHQGTHQEGGHGHKDSHPHRDAQQQEGAHE